MKLLTHGTNSPLITENVGKCVIYTVEEKEVTYNITASQVEKQIISSPKTWRVFAEDSENIYLIGYTGNLHAKGLYGWLYSPGIFDNIADYVFSNSEESITARCLKVSDILQVCPTYSPKQEPFVTNSAARYYIYSTGTNTSNTQRWYAQRDDMCYSEDTLEKFFTVTECTPKKNKAYYSSPTVSMRSVKGLSGNGVQTTGMFGLLRWRHDRLILVRHDNYKSK